MSRQLWWGHRIPAWYIYKDDNAAQAADKAAAEGGPAPGADVAWVVALDEADALQQVCRPGELPPGWVPWGATDCGKQLISHLCSKSGSVKPVP